MSDEAFNDFVLVGGTALSLQLGHRVSVDIDLFTSMPFGTMNREAIRNALLRLFTYTDRLETMTEGGFGYSVYVGRNDKESVKLDMY
jgi:hypothetical protein